MKPLGECPRPCARSPPTDSAASDAEGRKLTIKTGESLAVALKRKKAETSTGPIRKAVSNAVGGLLAATVRSAFRLGETLGKIREVVENVAAGNERLERGQDEFRSLLMRRLQ